MGDDVACRRSVTLSRKVPTRQPSGRLPRCVLERTWTSSKRSNSLALALPEMYATSRSLNLPNRPSAPPDWPRQRLRQRRGPRSAPSYPNWWWQAGRRSVTMTHTRPDRCALSAFGASRRSRRRESQRFCPNWRSRAVFRHRRDRVGMVRKGVYNLAGGCVPDGRC